MSVKCTKVKDHLVSSSLLQKPSTECKVIPFSLIDLGTGLQIAYKPGSSSFHFGRIKLNIKLTLLMPEEKFSYLQ